MKSLTHILLILYTILDDKKWEQDWRFSLPQLVCSSRTPEAVFETPSLDLRQLELPVQLSRPRSIAAK